MSGWVYFIRAGESGPIKVGWTMKCVSRRIATLQTGSSERLCVIKTIEAEDKSAEKDWHRALAFARLHGEWFSPDPEVLNIIHNGILPPPEESATVTLTKPRKPLVDRAFTHWFSGFGFDAQQECADALQLHKSTVCRMLKDENYRPDKMTALHIERVTSGRVPATSWKRVAA